MMRAIETRDKHKLARKAGEKTMVDKKTFRAQTLKTITYGVNNQPGWIKIDGKRYWVETSTNRRVGQLWVHAKPGSDSLLYFSGVALIEGDADSNHEFAMKLIRDGLAEKVAAE
jgi:hypothetical protein